MPIWRSTGSGRISDPNCPKAPLRTLRFTMGVQTTHLDTRLTLMSAERDPAEGYNAAIAAELRAERGAVMMTNKEIAAASGVSLPSVSRYMTAKRHIDVTALYDIAIAMGTTPSEIATRAQIRLANEGGFVAEGVTLTPPASE